MCNCATVQLCNVNKLCSVNYVLCASRRPYS